MRIIAVVALAWWIVDMAMPLHGTHVEGYHLVDIGTGTVIAIHAHDILDPEAAPLPAWAKRVNAKQ